MNALNKCTIFTEEEMNNMESEIRRFQDMCTSDAPAEARLKWILEELIEFENNLRYGDFTNETLYK